MTVAELDAAAAAARAQRRLWRRLKDRVTTVLMALGGIGVIAAIVLIFFYLLYVVLPLFAPAKARPVQSYDAPGGAGPTLHLALDEYAEVGLRVAAGEAVFFRAADGAIIDRGPLPGIGAASISAAGAGAPGTGAFALGLDDGRALVARYAYEVSYPGDERRITPRIDYPLGPQPVAVDPAGAPISAIAVQARAERVVLVAATGGGPVRVVAVDRIESLLDGSVTLERTESVLPHTGAPAERLLLGPEQRRLYVLEAGGHVAYYDLADPAAPRLVDRRSVVRGDAAPSAWALAAGGISLLVGATDGGVAQWFPVADRNNVERLTFVRAFHAQEASITAIVPEHSRRGFIALGADGSLGLYHATAHRTLLVERGAQRALVGAAMAPRADAALVLDAGGRLALWAIDNPHPEVSWRALWGKVWYEGRQRPAYVWQSSAAANDFEPKFSLTPLAFGTLKAAFYAMLFAVPIAIAGAVYAGYFMSARMRGLVKPTIEVMAALPTVILGFLAGLWLAPLVERNLAGVLLLLPAVPLAVLAAAWLWQRLPGRLRHRVPDGWEAALLVPVLCAAIAAAMAAGEPVEALVFGGDLPGWLTRELGIAYDQRNSLVVGVMMGFAVIPTIFSISEDAVVGVPRHLTIGSLALGATPWQTMVRVVLLTASPGIFSGVMIGLGRAVGETMIVLMATGNTPIMDMNIFQGFRALSANIAVEMPESEVASTHFRILFLAGLVLFVATFLFNTLGELVRQRLRAKYASL